ncbi:hypothetical protein L6452_09654 [Arctium lappa]|uniref:Uncharacterized protein n=1 Tax=Arctium lappa TaxID=4217 RepID=A0ACB9DKL4_ARCLA|nr:hypothetical protein L6452_09654 [Arctium lappa]
MDSCSPFDSLLFDLDDTLYSSNIGFGDATKRNIDDFLVEKCGFEQRKASALRLQLFKTYGSTLAGLRSLGYDVDADDYHRIVHGRLPYHLIKPDPQLRNLLLSISQQKIDLKDCRDGDGSTQRRRKIMMYMEACAPITG